MKSLSATIQMKATEQYFPVMLFILLYKVVLPFESVDEILKCDHSNESCSVVPSLDVGWFSIFCKSTVFGFNLRICVSDCVITLTSKRS